MKITKTINFIDYQKYFFLASALLVLLSVGLLFTKSLNFGIDFKGGRLVELKTNDLQDISTLRQFFSANESVNNVAIQQFDNNILLFNVSVNEDVSSQEFVETVKASIKGDYEVLRIEFVGPSLSSTLLKNGIYSLIAGLFAVFVYIWFRFDWNFGVVAVITLFHDVVISLGLLSLMWYELNITAIAAFLTIIGYSINDTVVIFDQLRENIKTFSKTLTTNQIINRSVNQMIKRSVLTSATTLFVALSLYLFGGDVLRSFSFIISVGLIIGTYSSLFVAAPLLTYLGNVTSILPIEDDEEKDGKKVARKR